MKTVKILDIKDLSDKTLKEILNFNPYYCEEVLIRINSKITMDDIKKKVLELTKIYCNIAELLCWEENIFPPYSEKYNNFWIDIHLDNEGEIDIVADNSREISYAIRILMDALECEELIGGIENYIGNIFSSEYSFIKRAGSKEYFNFNYIFKYEEY